MVKNMVIVSVKNVQETTCGFVIKHVRMPCCVFCQCFERNSCQKKHNTNDGRFHKDFCIETGIKKPLRHLIKKKNPKGRQTTYKRPLNNLQKSSFWTFCMGDCKSSLDKCRIATMTSPPLETISINVFLEAPKMR
jgi:hypothetical protein